MNTLKVRQQVLHAAARTPDRDYRRKFDETAIWIYNLQFTSREESVATWTLELRLQKPPNETTGVFITQWLDLRTYDRSVPTE